MDEIVKKINIALRIKGEKQNYLCEILKLSKTQISNRMNQKVEFQDFELDMLVDNGLIQSYERL